MTAAGPTPTERRVTGSVWSPELELLARLARIRPTATDTSRAAALASSPLAWDRVLALAARHGVAPLVVSNLAHLGSADVPEPVLAHLRDLAISFASANLRTYGRWISVARTLGEHGIQAVTLKGFHVALSLYGSLGLRTVGDLDFLVNPEDVPAALRPLGTLGYRPSPRWELALRRVGLSEVLRSAVELSFVADDGSEVDLHWGVRWGDLTLPAQEILRAPESLRVGDESLAVPSRDVLLPLLLLHAHGSGWPSLRHVVDLAELLDGGPDGTDPPGLGRIDELRARPALETALWLLDTLWGRPAPASLGAGARVTAPPPKTRDDIRFVLEADAARDGGRTVPRAMRALRRRRTMGTPVHRILAGAFRPELEDWAFIPLPRSLRRAYPLVRPVRILLEIARDSLRRG